MGDFFITIGGGGQGFPVRGFRSCGASQVKFGSVKATSYTVNSGTTITTTVPAGAKSGKVSVKTAGGSVSSKGMFTVTN